METIDISKIEFNQKQKSQFKELGISIIYLFGSYAEGNQHPLSDIDFGIVLESPEKNKQNTKEIYQELYKIFNEVLPDNYLKRRFELREHEFDIVFLQFAPPSLQLSAIQGEVVYEQEKKSRFSYQEQVMRKTADLKPFRELHQQAILYRI